MITQAELKKVLSYDKATGVFVWVKRLSNRVKVGQIAGSTAEGRRNIKIHGKLYKAHILAFIYENGCLPADKLDHKDRNPLNNSMENLREATHSQNMANRPAQKNNKSGLKGIYRDRKTNRWVARIKAAGKRYSLGMFDCPAAAHFAYQIAADTYFGEFARIA